jgi:hypothetical protein
LVFQIPDSLRLGLLKKLRVKLAFRSKVRAVLRSRKSYAMEMHCIKEDAVRKLVQKSGGRVVDVRLTNSTDSSFCGDLQYINQEPESGYVSKQYCVVKQ